MRQKILEFSVQRSAISDQTDPIPGVGGLAGDG